MSYVKRAASRCMSRLLCTNSKRMRSHARVLPLAMKRMNQPSIYVHRHCVHRRQFSAAAGSGGIHPDFQTSYKTGDIEQVKKQIQADVEDNQVFLFMKGTPEMPQCGFSKNLITVLNYLEVDFKTRDVLSHPALRQAVKEFSDWPTFPQLYYKGELVGGHDIVVDMFKNGELQQLFGIEDEEAGGDTESNKKDE